MNEKKIFLLSVYFSISLIVYFSSSAWFVYFPKEYLYILTISFSVFQIGVNSFSSKIDSLREFFDRPLWIIMICFTSLFLFIVFPIRNLNLGDGVLLLEHVALEAKIFGFHLTMDEILEALIHSILYVKFSNLFTTPMDVYRLVSTACGFFALFSLYYYFRKFQIGVAGFLLVLSSGGMYLFHGYSENYTIITTVLWIYILFSMNLIMEGSKRNLQALLPITFLACILILLHLVSGYLLLSLIYLCYHFSDKGKFIQNALYCTFFSLLILAPVFLYFIFLSEVRFDFTQTHLTNPKFYPISKIISTLHVRDIFFCILGSSLLPFIVLVYYSIFYKKDIMQIFKRKEIRFLFFVFIGFSLHGFVHYPQLGFPADWDLLAFFWSPIAFLSVFIWQGVNNLTENAEGIKNQNISIELAPLFLFAISIYVLNMFYLSKPDASKMGELGNSIHRIDRFSNSEPSKFLSKVQPKYKKFYLRVSFFLFESKEKILEHKAQDVTNSQKLLDQNESFLQELDLHIENIESKWQKDFYSRMTIYHLEYLEFLKKK